MNAPQDVTPTSSPPRLLRLTPVLLGTLLCSTSCSDDQGSGSQHTLESWSLSEEPSVAIGGTDEREGYLLHRVVGATRLEDGRIVRSGPTKPRADMPMRRTWSSGARTTASTSATPGRIPSS